MIEFICAVYNESAEINSLVSHIHPFVDRLNFVDDGSTDDTPEQLEAHFLFDNFDFRYKRLEHTGLPETVKAEALKMCADGSWVIMLDADERFQPNVPPKIVDFIKSPESENVDYVYFNQIEIIDNLAVRTFQKCKLFRKEAMTFPLENIHADDILTGRGIYKNDWVVLHRKTSKKQVLRETEYLLTYKKLLEEGKIDQGRYEWLVRLHHYVRPHG